MLLDDVPGRGVTSASLRGPSGTEAVAWVASRVAPATLGNLMTRHQARAYGRAAGFKSACELLRVTEVLPT